MEFIIVAAIFFSIVFVAVPFLKKAQIEKAKQQQKQAQAIEAINHQEREAAQKQLNNRLADYKAKKAAEKSPAKLVEPMKPRIQSTLRDHMHGTTTITSADNCKKEHDGLKDDPNYLTKDIDQRNVAYTNEEYARMIVIGDAINNPAFKRAHR